MEFKLGDRVYNTVSGSIGTVVRISGPDMEVEFDHGTSGTYPIEGTGYMERSKQYIKHLDD